MVFFHTSILKVKNYTYTQCTISTYGYYKFMKNISSNETEKIEQHDCQLTAFSSTYLHALLVKMKFTSHGKGIVIELHKFHLVWGADELNKAVDSSFRRTDGLINKLQEKRLNRNFAAYLLFHRAFERRSLLENQIHETEEI